MAPQFLLLLLVLGGAPSALASTAGIDLSGCGSTKGCFLVPSSCTDPTACVAILTWQATNSNQDILFEMGANNAQWVAVGFSTDNKMGDDSVMDCTENQGTSLVEVRNSYNPGGAKFNRPISAPDNTDAISGEAGSITGTSLACNFTRKRTPTSGNSEIWDLNTNYFLLLAYGQISSGTSKSAHGFSGDAFPAITSDVVDLTSYGAQTGEDISAKTAMVKAHGAMMILAWITIAGIGIITARYYKAMWPTKKPCGKDLWFPVHQVCMVTVFVLTLTAAILIIVEVGGFMDFQSLEPAVVRAHPFLGFIVTALVIINPIMAVFRPHPGTEKRPIFNWAHWAVGTGAHIIGGVTVFLGLNLPKGVAVAGSASMWIILAYVIFHVLVEIALSVHKCMVKKPEEEPKKEEINLDLPGEQKEEEVVYPPNSTLLTVLYATYVTVAVGVGLAVTILIAI